MKACINHIDRNHNFFLKKTKVFFILIKIAIFLFFLKFPHFSTIIIQKRSLLYVLNFIILKLGLGVVVDLPIGGVAFHHGRHVVMVQ